MTKISKTKAAGRTIGIGVGAFISKTILVELQNAQFDQATIAFIIVAVVLISAKLLEILTGEILERWLWLRRVVSGQSYIEGHWIDRADYGGGLFGIISVQNVDDSVVVHGDAFTDTGTLVYCWDSVLSKFDGSKLEYLYRTTNLEKGSPFEERFGFLTESFERQTATKAPTSFTGTFVDFGGNQTTSNTRGARITPREAETARRDGEFLRNLATDKLGHLLCKTTNLLNAAGNCGEPHSRPR